MAPSGEPNFAPRGRKARASGSPPAGEVRRGRRQPAPLARVTGTGALQACATASAESRNAGSGMTSVADGGRASSGPTGGDHTEAVSRAGRALRRIALGAISAIEEAVELAECVDAASNSASGTPAKAFPAKQNPRDHGDRGNALDTLLHRHGRIAQQAQEVIAHRPPRADVVPQLVGGAASRFCRADAARAAYLPSAAMARRERYRRMSLAMPSEEITREGGARRPDGRPTGALPAGLCGHRAGPRPRAPPA